MTGHGVLTPALMVLLFMTNDFLAMSLTTDRASPAPTPSVWRMRNITAAAVVLGVCKLGFSTAILAVGKFQLGFAAGELQTLAFVTLVFGNQAVLYVLRERRHMWSSKPSNWIVAASAGGYCDRRGAGVVGDFDGSRWRGQSWRPSLSPRSGFALILDQIKLPVTALSRSD